MMRKSVLSVNNLLMPENEHVDKVSPVIPSFSPRPSIRKNTKFLKNKDQSPRSSLQKKKNQLKGLKLTDLHEKNTNFLSGFKKSPKSNFCISELWGSKEKYLQKTGYLNAYNELKKTNEFEKLINTKTSRKLEGPYADDLLTVKKTLFLEKRLEHSKQSPLNTIFELKLPKNLSKKGSEIDHIIKKCNDLSKRTLSIKNKTINMQKIIKNYSEKQFIAQPKLKGLSNSTSNEIFQSYKRYD